MSEELFASLPSGCWICYQGFGTPSDTAILLVSGDSCAMTQKSDGIIRLLGPPDHPHFIFRFDHRDTGRSTSFTKPSDGTPVYTLDDMVDDIVELTKHLKLTHVHLIGTSLGGTLVWQTVTRLPDVVRSLALVLTSPVGRQQLPNDNLPQVHLEGQWLLAVAYEIPDNRDDDEGWIQSYMRLDLALATQPPTEEEKAESRRESEIIYYREKESGTMRSRELLKEIRCPTVVIHAAKDQIFPLKHAEALRDDVEGATLVIIEDCGH
ncbi:alpha/beta-hydrolase [Trichoderma compactum]